MIYVFLANGFEEIEALTPVDVLRRAGLTVQTVGIGEKVVTSSHKVPVTADITDAEMELNGDLQAVILPGGMPGTKNLDASEAVTRALEFAKANDLFICAICAAPSVLGHKGLLSGKEAICFPGFESELTGATLSENFVCRDGKVITGKGMGVATEFALEIASALAGDEDAEKVRAAIQFPR